MEDTSKTITSDNHNASSEGIIEKHCREGKLHEAFTELKLLSEFVTPNDLSIYMKLLSLEEDIKNDRRQDLILNGIRAVYKEVLLSRLTKGQRQLNLVLSLLAYSLIPIMPMLAGYIKGTEPSNESVMLSLALYCISVSLSIKHTSVRLIGVILSIFPFLLMGENVNFTSLCTSIIIALVIFSMHLSDRTDRHLVNHEPFLS